MNITDTKMVKTYTLTLDDKEAYDIMDYLIYHDQQDFTPGLKALYDLLSSRNDS